MFVTPALQQIVTLAMLVMMLFMVGEGIWLGRMINNRVAERFRFGFGVCFPFRFCIGFGYCDELSAAQRQ